MRTPRELRERTSSLMVKLRTAIRRMTLAATSGGLWQVVGYTDDDRDEGIPVFQGIGIVARPRAGRGEAIVAKVGIEGHAVLVALRDESIRIEIDEDETALINSTGAKIHVTKGGDIIVQPAAGREVLVRHEGGAAAALATKADLDALAGWVEDHIHPAGTPNTGPPLTASPGSPVPEADGTSTLKGA